ncbi:MAG: GNAT family N-acetyltransferase, partial [Brachybacterium sp.]
MSTAQITDVDPSRAEDLLAWNTLLGEGFNAGREAAWWASDESVLAQYGYPKPERTSVLLVATLDGRPVGAASADADPGEPAEVEISVLPDARRQGVGTALAEAVRERLRGVADVVQAETYSEAGAGFATELGLRVGNQEHRLLLDLPVDLEALRAQHPAPSDVEVRSWTGACPDNVLEDWARLTTQMEEDVPMGDLTRRASRGDVESVRRGEQRMADQGWILVRSLARLGGVSVGYTEIFVSRHDPEIITQDDTL